MRATDRPLAGRDRAVRLGIDTLVSAPPLPSTCLTDGTRAIAADLAISTLTAREGAALVAFRRALVLGRRRRGVPRRDAAIPLDRRDLIVLGSW